MMNRKLSFLAAALVVASGAAFAAEPPAADGDSPAYHKGMHHKGMHDAGMDMPGLMHPRMLERMADELKLTPAQRDSIKSAFERDRPRMQELRNQLDAEREKLAAVKPDEAAYSGTVATSSQAIGNLTAQMIVAGSQLKAEIHRVLTAEQRAALEAKRAEMKSRMEAHAGERHERMRERREAKAAEGV